MKRKLLAIFLASVIAIGMTGCGGNNSNDSNTTNKEATSDQVSNAPEVKTDELVNIIWQWPTFGAKFSGLQAVEDALNAMTEKDIGVHVTLQPVTATDLVNQTTLAVSSGDQLDISLQLITGAAPYVASGVIQPIDQYIDEYGADIKQVCGDNLSGGYYKGQLYGVPCNYIAGNSFGYVARKDILDECGITIDPNKKYTIKDMDEIFAKVRAKKGEKVFMYIPGTVYPYMFGAGSYCEVDALGATFASGVLMLNRSFTDLTIVNVFETKEYKAYAQQCYDWAQKGYVSADASTNTENTNTLLSTGNYLGQFTTSTPNTETDMEAAVGTDLVTIHMLDGYVVTTLPPTWQVPITSVNPAKAVETLNYIYKNPEATKLLQFGIEGQSYEVVESNDTTEQIKFVAEDPSTLPYYMPFGVYGNRLEWPVIYPAPIDMYSQLAEWDAAIVQERKSPAYGYAFTAEPVATEYSAVTSMISQYQAAINSGSIDPAQLLPEFIDSLKAAGIDKVIAENQKQLNEWAANKNK